MKKIILISFILFFISCSNTNDKLNFSRVWYGYPIYDHGYKKNVPRNMYIIFKKNGVLLFKNGFVWHGPSKWKYNKKRELLYLYLRNFSLIKKYDLNLQKKLGHIYNFNIKQKYIVYRINKFTKKILFRSYYFYPKNSSKY